MVLYIPIKKGVEKMNSFLDYREAYFKEKVMTLMSRPAVMKTLNNKNNLMSKKNVPAEAKAKKEQKTSFSSPTNNKSSKDQ